jgi:3-methylcrotonyl-CoA carboxylase alpha subunit
MRLRCGDVLFEVELRQGKGEWEARVNGETVRLRLESLEDARAVVRHAGEDRVLRFARDGGLVHLFWEGVSYKLALEREGGRRVERHDKGALEAPMPGRVSALRVAPGAHVRKGEELLVVEAMKMENALRAPRDGVVRAVHVSVGDMVAPGRPLVEIDEEGGGS